MQVDQTLNTGQLSALPKANDTLDSAIDKKLMDAEYYLSVVRMLLVLANPVIFTIFISGEKSIPELAWPIMCIAVIYAAYVLIAKPYRKYQLLRTSYFTTISDGSLITLWLIATGGADSPFFILWYISIIAVAMRFSLKETVLTALLYLCIDMLIVLMDGNKAIDMAALMVRFYYMPIIGVLGVFISQEVDAHINDKAKIEKAEAKLKKANDQLELRVQQRTQELEEINKDILDSITYAKRIQGAILPTKKELNRSFSDVFVINRPKDIISGDFYWIHDRIDRTILALVDCTGHGVPGALMAMMGNNNLDNIVKDRGLTDPREILFELDIAVSRSLTQKSDESQVHDGMVISLIVLNKVENTITFSGAQQSILLYQNDELTELRGDRHSIGGMLVSDKKSFNSETRIIGPGDRLYLYSDGYQDQFGGPKSRKFLRKQFKDLIAETASISMAEQGTAVDKTFVRWKGRLAQVDDVTVIGIEI